MSDGCPMDRPVNIPDFGIIDPSGCAKMFLHSFLCFKNYLIGNEGIDNDACHHAYKTSKGQKNQGQLGFNRDLHGL